MFSLLQVVSHDLSHIHHTPAEDHPTKVTIMWFSHLVVVNTQKKNSGITHPKNEQNGLGWDNGFGPTPNLQFSSQLWGILKANSHQTSSNPQIPKRNPGLVLDLQYLFFLRAGDCESAFFSLMLHQDIIYIYASDVAARSHLWWYIYIYAYLKNFIQLGHKKQNILHMHSEKLNNGINGSMSFSQWISERKFNFALLRHAQMIGLCLLLCCRFL